MWWGQLDICQDETSEESYEYFKSCDYTDPRCEAYTGEIIDTTNGPEYTTEDGRYTYLKVNNGDCVDNSEIFAGRMGSGLECSIYCDEEENRLTSSYNGNCYCEDNDPPINDRQSEQHVHSQSELAILDGGSCNEFSQAAGYSTWEKIHSLPERSPFYQSEGKCT